MSEIMNKNISCKILTNRLLQFIPLKDVCGYIGIQVVDLAQNPIIIDGRHRYIAAVLRRDKNVKAIFSGHKELFDYLTGSK